MIERYVAGKYLQKKPTTPLLIKTSQSVHI